MFYLHLPRSPLKTPGSKSHSRFQVFGNEKTYDFQAQDHRTRAQWLKAFRTAFDYSADMLVEPPSSSKKTGTAASGSEAPGSTTEDGMEGFGRQRYQRQLLEKRRAARAEEKEREDEERAALGDQVT